MEKIKDGESEIEIIEINDSDDGDDSDVEIIELEAVAAQIKIEVGNDGEGEGEQQLALGDALATPNTNIQHEVRNESVVNTTTAETETGYMGNAEHTGTGGTGMMEMNDLESRQMFSTNDVNAIRSQVYQMRPAELKEFVVKKIVEAFNANTMIGELRTKCLQLNGLADRLFQKSNILQKQVSDLSRAMKVYEANEAAKNPEDKKFNVPLKFCRSVGLQVCDESFPKNTPQNCPIPNKRMRPMANSNEVMNQVAQPNMAQPHSSRQIHIQPNNGNSGPINVNGNVNVGQSTVNSGRAALPLTATVNANEASSTTGGLTVGQGGSTFTRNGVKYRVLSQNGQGSQLVSSPSGYHFVSPDGNIRPVTFRQAGTNIKTTQPPTQVLGQNRYRMDRGPIIIRSNLQGQGQQNHTGGNSTNYVSHSHGPLAQIAPQSGQPSPKTKFTMPHLPRPTGRFHSQKRLKEVPPKPELGLKEQDGEIAVHWTHIMDETKYAEIKSYHLFSCQEPLNPNNSGFCPVWNKVGDIKALTLPMLCTLTQFSGGSRYHFIVRGIDIYNRSGRFSEIVSIVV